MNDTAISVRNLSKSYRMYPSPKERMKELLHPFGKKYHKDFWALRDVSFEVKKGETIGIIGRNGSGKSTLLQVLCGIMQPTEGEVTVNGRISALLELGAGFNRDFTGRENVYMNGALMGFTREEMDDRIQSIIEFADIGEFIDQPVKIYSSGMYVRLAFAVAINIDPDILVIDEALSVGDMKFQKKCMEKIDNIRESGKTILFCSHDMHAISELCNDVKWINDGMIADQGSPNKTIASYVSFMTAVSQAKNVQLEEKNVNNPNYFVRNSEEVEIISVELFDVHHLKKDVFHTGDDLVFEVTYNAFEGIQDPNYSVILFRKDKIPVGICKTNFDKNLPPRGYIRGLSTFRVILKNIRLNQGHYTFGISIWDKAKKICFADNITKEFEIKSLKITFGPTEGNCIYFPEIDWKY